MSKPNDFELVEAVIRSYHIEDGREEEDGVNFSKLCKRCSEQAVFLGNYSLKDTRNIVGKMIRDGMFVIVSDPRVTRVRRVKASDHSVWRNAGVNLQVIDQAMGWGKFQMARVGEKVTLHSLEDKLRLFSEMAEIVTIGGKRFTFQSGHKKFKLKRIE